MTDGNYEEAILAFQAAIEIEPKLAQAYLSLSEVYLAMGDADAALAVVDDAAAIQGKLEELAAAPEPDAQPETKPEPAEVLEVTATSQAELDALVLRGDADKSTEVSCFRANITDLSALRSLTSLTRLDLSSNNISDLTALSGLTNLTELDVQCNNLTQQQVDELQAALPGCKIRFS